MPYHFGKRKRAGLYVALAEIGMTTRVAAAIETESAVSISAAGWTVEVNPVHSVLRVAHERLGTVMRDVQLSLSRGHDALILRNWSMHRTANRIHITTTDPRTAWVLELTPDVLVISSTSSGAALKARVPAPAERMPVRLMDAAGAPVTWAGTDEIASTYGGTPTRNPAFLPRRNPEVMNFSLGLVSSALLHSLFDRSADIAIDFPDDTLMTRRINEPEMLDVTIPVPEHAVVRVVRDYFTQTLRVPSYVSFDDTRFERPPTVWSSWTSYYDHVTEEDVVRNTDWIAANLRPYGFQYVELDDGYDRGKNGEHYWIERWDQKKFPHGPQWLASYIKRKGLHPGLWLVPNSYAGAVQQHPDWYLRDKAGKLLLDYNTPALDASHPEVIAFLKREFKTLDSWGFEYYKFDGEYAVPKYVPTVDSERLHDSSSDPLAVYRNRLDAIRATIGPDRFVEGCPAGTSLDGVGYFNSYFNGQDLYTSWQGMYPLFSSINANVFLNHLLAYVMPGEGMELSPPMTVREASARRDARVVEIARQREDPLMGFGTTLAEARTVVSYVALTGVAYPIANVMSELPPERVDLLKKTLPTLPILPVDLFSRGTDIRWDTFKRSTSDTYIHNFPEVLDLKINAASGVYDVAALTNWRSAPVTRELSFADKLGLSAGVPYVVFDFWSEKLLGVFTDRVSVAIEPHDTRVLAIHPALDRPQLVGISRHISGSYSVLSLSWDDSSHRLRGSSQVVPGAVYTLFVRVPEGMRAVHAAASAAGRDVPVRQVTDAGLMQLTFAAQSEAVDWTLTFVERAAGTRSAH